ncbi:MAG: hypothetical protein OEY49_14370, partial [Candidatus Heimdallarchaeota archaeon]|nr:hypothetical protein [Candidatus Heimdallarchaeota archaeon]
NVTHNGGLFTTSTAWTNGAVNVDIDGLSGGIHVFTIFVYDLDFNMATDTVYVTVKSEFITADLSSPSDLTYEFHSFGNQIICSVGDDNPGVYNITLDGTIFSSTTSWSNGTISINVDGLTVGVHEFIIYVYDLEYNLVTDSVFVTVYKELNMPDLSTPADIIYQYESTGNQIQWTVGDINPSVYNITINGEILRPTTNWINGTITVSVDGLDIGSYTIIIFVYDLNGNRATDTVLVTVFSETTPPEISSPDDITYVFDSIENVIVWNVGDAHPGLYNMSVNGNLFMTNVEWNNGTIPLNVDGLDVGTHIFVISVCDTYFNCVQDTVVVTVTAVEDTSSSIPPTVIFSVVGVVVVAIGYFVYRKRKSG